MKKIKTKLALGTITCGLLFSLATFNTSKISANTASITTPNTSIIDDVKISYTGAWETFIWAPNQSFVDVFHNKTRHISNQKDSVMNYTFTGTGIDWYGNRSVDYGYAEVFIDGNYSATINLYEKRGPGPLNPRLIYPIRGLEFGQHTLEIKTLGKKDPKSGNTFVDIDYLEIHN
ncbi:hypothetical protein CO726_29905 [Bacillus fungorum]|uniref:Uncharacterized protein n=1 Tax=Bacillus fungorum TaxID=2039284 RepID=A0A2G6Q4X7_9BACI|nr:hypothetical protein [Bacillus fungorum]PIE91841.1 hypothetical protein CO726_29905 [Bacillus fungorum]